MSERKLYVNTGRTILENTIYQNIFSWPDFINTIKSFRVIEYTADEYIKLDKNIKTRAKDTGYFIFGKFSKNIRREENLIHREGLTLDFDDVTYKDMTDTIKALESSNYNYCLYTTAGYDGSNGKFRVILPFNKPIEPKDYKKVAERIVQNTFLPKNVDPASFIVSQAMFLPTKCIDVEPVFKYRADGDYFEVDSYLIDEPIQQDITNIKPSKKLKYDDLQAMDLVKKKLRYEDIPQNYNETEPWIWSIIKGVQDGEISEEVAPYLLKLISAGNEEWEKGNIEYFNRNKDEKPRTEYGFSKRYDFQNWIRENISNIKHEYTLASLIMEEINPVKYGETVYFKYEDRYTSDEDILRRLIFKYAIGKRTRFIDETIKQMQYRAKYIPIDTPMKIVFNNGYLENGIFVEGEYTGFTPYKIDIDYNPTAQSDELVDDYINNLTGDDIEYRNLLIEILGHTLIVNPEFKRALGKFFIFIGDGGNGKGTLLQILTKILGRENVTALSIKELSDERYSNTIKGKLANLGDDLQDQAINEKDMKVLKNISTCDDFSIRELYKKPENIQITATLIFTSNHAIKSFEKGKSYRRRVMWLPMFSKVEKIDPYFISKLTTDERLIYWISLFVEGYKRLYKNKAFTKSETVENYNLEYHNENNPAWIYLEELEEEDFIDEPVASRRTDFMIWCSKNDYKFNHNFLLDALKEKWGIDGKGYRRINGVGTRVYRKIIQ